MSIFQKIKTLAEKINSHGTSIATEEATKNALIMPFIHSILEYDIFNPNEVIPEYTSDHGIRKGEKVDYAIMDEGEVRILIECKKLGAPLSAKHASQLYRYFSVTDARIAILTNGAIYQFYTDLDKPNQMDNKPFLEIDLNNPDEATASEIIKITKSAFDLNSIISAAGDLKYLNQLKKRIEEEVQNPSDEFIKLFTAKVYDGVITQKIKAQFAITLKKAFKQYLTDKINDRLTTALQNNNAETDEDKSDTKINIDRGIETTNDEVEGYNIVKAIIRKNIAVSRITYRDTKSYFGVLLDDNNRKPICRLHFNRTQKYIGIFCESKSEERHPIEKIDDIFNYAKQLKNTAESYGE